MSSRFGRFGFLFLVVLAAVLGGLAAAKIGDESQVLRWRQHDLRRPRPPVVEPAAAPAATLTPAPKDATILFDGSGLEAWETPEGRPAAWALKNGHFEVAPGTGPIQTKMKFGDVQLHVEWAAPDPPTGVGQDRGNSGIFLMGQFEVQVLDSYKSDTYPDGLAGAIYGQYPPLSNAARPPGQWQSYDIAFRRPRFDKAGKLLEPARLTVFFNGILVQNNEEPWGQTSWLEPIPYDPAADRGPIQLQDHSHPVKFRNIWVRELPERPAPTAEELKRPKVAPVSAETLDAFTGRYERPREPRTEPWAITREDGHLLLTLPFRPTPVPLEPMSETVFVLPHTDGRISFQMDERGRVSSARFRVGDGEQTLKKLKD
jgi:hypothetical protein